MKRMSMQQRIEQVSCPSCGAGPGKSCTSQYPRAASPDTMFLRKNNYCHAARKKLYEKRGRPVHHKPWPVGPSPT